MKKNRHFNEEFLLLIILLLFFLFGAFLAINIKIGISPDEIYHIEVSKMYSETLLIPENTEETYTYGDITRIPYLSFWLNGRLINLNFTGIQDYIVLRFFNLFISLGSLIVVFLISKEIIGRKYLNLIPVFLLANTLMFVFLSSAVSYDNLSNFLIFLTIYFFVRFFKYKSTPSLIYLVIFQILALLAKFTIAPVVFIEVIIVVGYFIKRKEMKPIIKDIFRKHKILCSLMISMITLAALLYGVNLLKFNTLQPKCDQILEVDQCMKNGVYSRGETLDRYDFENLKELVEILNNRKTPYEYFHDWIMGMAQRTYGIMGHRSLFMNRYFVNLYLILFSISSLTVLRKWKRADGIETKLIIVSLFYILILLIYKNYNTYLHRDIFGLALQGRYIFPILPIVYMVFIKYLIRINSGWFKILTVAAILVLFLLGCIPYFLVFVPNTWFIN